MINFSSRTSRVLVATAAILALAVASVEARPSGGRSFGSRGSKTFAAPPPTATAPSAAAPIQRSVTQPVNPGAVAQAPAASQAKRGMFGGFGGGLLAGLLGAGLFGMLFGGGFLGGLGGLMSLIGLLLQIALLAGVVMLALRFFRNRANPATAAAGNLTRRSAADPRPSPRLQPAAAMGAAGFAAADRRRMESGTPTGPVEISERDFAAFERLLTEINAVWDAEDEGGIRRFTTPEMAAYFGEDLAKNASKGLHDRVKDIKLLQGDLSEAWREGSVDYATVAMRYSCVNALFERATGRVIEGDPVKPQEVTEIWTFARERGRNWVLSAIQQVG